MKLTRVALGLLLACSGCALASADKPVDKFSHGVLADSSLDLRWTFPDSMVARIALIKPISFMRIDTRDFGYARWVHPKRIEILIAVGDTVTFQVVGVD